MAGVYVLLELAYVPVPDTELFKTTLATRRTSVTAYIHVASTRTTVHAVDSGILWLWSAPLCRAILPAFITAGSQSPTIPVSHAAAAPRH